MKRILLLFMTLLSIAGADACRHKTYKIDISGEEVVLYFPMVATDTDYRFILDGTEIRQEYDSRKGFIIRFTMPEHDVTLRYLQRNSMNEIPEPWR